MDTVVLREKGSAGINKASQERNDTLEVHSGDIVHETCRQTYTNKILIRFHLQNTRNQKDSSDVSHLSLHSAERIVDISNTVSFVVFLPSMGERKDGLMLSQLEQQTLINR